MPFSFARATAVAAPIGGREVLRRLGSEKRIDDGFRAGADRARVEPACQCRHQADVGQTREPAADARVMLEHRDAELREQRPEAVGFAGLRRLGDAEKELRDLRFEARRLDGRKRRDGLRQSFRRAARFRRDDET